VLELPVDADWMRMMMWWSATSNSVSRGGAATWSSRRRVIHAREEERKMETMTAVKWVPPVDDRTKKQEGQAAVGLAWAG
jgi:hypothetical protein